MDKVFTSEPMLCEGDVKVLSAPNSETHVKSALTTKGMSKEDERVHRADAAEHANKVIADAIAEDREFIVLSPKRLDNGEVRIDMVGAFSPVNGVVTLLEAAKSVGALAQEYMPELFEDGPGE